MSGFLPLPRDFFTQFLWDEKRSFSKAEAYLDLLQFAAFAPSERFVSGKLIELDEGECIASVRFLAERWGWGKDKAAQFLQLLDTRRITRRETRQGETVVILCRYKDWRNQTDARPDSKADSDPDTDQTPTRTNNKKGKKDKSEKKAPARPRPFADAFNDFLDNYPQEAANDLQAIADKINGLSPIWKKHPHLTGMEMADLAHPMTAKAFMALEARDWSLLRDYLRAVIPEEWAAEKFWQPNQRSQFIRAIGDIIQKAEIWAMKSKWNHAA